MLSDLSPFGATPTPTALNILFGENSTESSHATLNPTLIKFEKAVDGLELQDLKAAIKPIIGLLDRMEYNEGGTRGLAGALYRLNNAVITPLLLSYQPASVSSGTDSGIGQLTSGLSELLKRWKSPGNPHEQLERLHNLDDNTLTIQGLNSRINDLIDGFCLQNRFANTVMGETDHRFTANKEEPTVSKNIQGLPHTAASYDSVSRIGAATCLPGTQEAILNTIDIWFRGNGHDIMLLKGGPGTGKSTIAQTVATHAAHHHLLAATFFFSKDEADRRSPQLFIPTLAFQLAYLSAEFDTRISTALEGSPRAVWKSLSKQLQTLLSEPFQDVSTLDSTLIIIIDALDECEEGGAVEFLQLLMSDPPPLPRQFKFLITTRPESHLQQVLDSLTSKERLLEVEIDPLILEDDIRRLLQHQLSHVEVLKLHPANEWELKHGDLETLTKAADRIFLVAFTMAEFIKSRKAKNPQSQLELLLQHNTKQSHQTRLSSAVLDYIYLQVLETAITDESIPENLRDVVGTIVLLEDPLPPQSMCNLLDIDLDCMKRLVGHLQFIIHFSIEDPRLRIHHPIFSDFVMNINRCPDERFLIQPKKHHSRTVDLCFGLMDRQLRRNICNIPFPFCYYENHAIPELSTAIKEHIPQELLYACCHWATHLSKSRSNSDRLMRGLERFTFQHLLFWLEVLSLTGNLWRFPASLKHAQAYAVAHNASKDLIKMLQDAGRFFTMFYVIIKKSALHLYYSALPFTPSLTRLYQQYMAEANGAVQVLRGESKSWDPPVQVLRGHTNSIISHSWSADSEHLASISGGKEVIVWDITNGAKSIEIKAPNRLTSVRFSPDDKRLVTGSDKGNVLQWDVKIGELLTVMRGHSGYVWGTEYSSDGSLLASVGADGTIRIWDTAVGLPVAMLEGHSGKVYSVMFSPDDSQLVTASDDGTLILWGTATGAPTHTLERHSDEMWAAVFSPDGKRIVSRSKDSIVQIWDVNTRKCIATLENNSIPIGSSVFSLDGAQVITASTDGWIRLWDAGSGALLATLSNQFVSVTKVSPDGTKITGACDSTLRIWNITALNPHVDEVDSLIFSLSGTHLASASNDIVHLWSTVDGTQIPTPRSDYGLVQDFTFSLDETLTVSTSNKAIHLWRASSGAYIGPLKGHSTPPFAVVPSADGTRLASISSDDDTICLWDTATKRQIAVLGGGEGQVLTAVFSSDGIRLATGSEDGTVRLWDAMVGANIAILKGHSGSIWKLAFSPCGNRLASGSDDNTVRLWGVAAGDHHTATLTGHSGPIFDVKFSPDGTRLASASEDGLIWVWDIVSITPLSSLEGHDSWVWEVAFSPDASRLASASSDLTLRIWDLATSTQVFKLDRHFCLPDVSNTFNELNTHVVERDGRPALVHLHTLADGSMIEVPICWLPAKHKPTRSRCNGSRVVIGTDAGDLLFLDVTQIQRS